MNAWASRTAVNLVESESVETNLLKARVGTRDSESIDNLFKVILVISAKSVRSIKSAGRAHSPA
jgi:hypothetical protein